MLKFLRTLSGPWAFFSRLRILCNGALIEDIDYYILVHPMFDVLQAKHVRDNQDVESGCQRFDSDATKLLIQDPIDITSTLGGTITTNSAFRDINVSVGANDSKTMSFTLLKSKSTKISTIKILPTYY